MCVTWSLGNARSDFDLLESAVWAYDVILMQGASLLLPNDYQTSNLGFDKFEGSEVDY